MKYMQWGPQDLGAATSGQLEAVADMIADEAARYNKK